MIRVERKNSGKGVICTYHNVKCHLFDCLAVLELAPVARDLIHIKGVHTGFYLAVNKHGHVYTTVCFKCSPLSRAETSKGLSLTFKLEG